MRDYKKIRAYQVSDELALEIYKLTKLFPKDEIYGLVSQMRRAAVSISCNIAEGASRQHLKDYLNFLYIARGSNAELEHLLSLTLRLGYVSADVIKNVSKRCIESAKTLSKLIQIVTAELKSL